MIQIKGNVYTTITNSIADTDSNPIPITVPTGHGARFAALSGGDHFVVALVDDPPNKVEEFLVYARSGDTLTALRARNGSSAQDWAPGDRIIGISDTPGVWGEHLDLLGLKGLAIASGTNTVTTSVAAQYQQLVDKMTFRVLAAGANTDAMTLAVTFDHSTYGGTTYAQAAKDIVDPLGNALVKGAVPTAGYLMELMYRSASDDFILLNPAYGIRLARNSRGVDDDFIRLSGGGDDGEGALMELMGQSHATLPGIARFTAIEWRALVTNLFDVSDDGGNSLFRVTDDGEASGEVIATLSDMQTNNSNTKLVTAEKVVHCPLVPKHIVVFHRNSDNSVDKVSDVGEGSLTISWDNSNARFNLSFGSAFDGTSYFALYFDSDVSSFSPQSASSARLNMGVIPASEKNYRLIIFGNKASA